VRHVGKTMFSRELIVIRRASHPRDFSGDVACIAIEDAMVLGRAFAAASNAMAASRASSIPPPHESRFAPRRNGRPARTSRRAPRLRPVDLRGQVAAAVERRRWVKSM
jgi:hypothetical protein